MGRMDQSWIRLCRGGGRGGGTTQELQEEPVPCEERRRESKADSIDRSTAESTDRLDSLGSSSVPSLFEFLAGVHC